MTVDYIFEFLTSLLDGFIGSDYLLIISMLIPCLAIFGFITIYALIVIYAEWSSALRSTEQPTLAAA